MAKFSTRPPVVSILVPVFNRKNYIADCIQSALNQTYTDFEVIVVDNASDDGTWEICKQFSEKDQRVRVFQNASNIGPVRNWLACVAEARGEYSKILWSDDLIHPEFLDKLLPYLFDASVGFVYSATDVFLGDKENISSKYFRGLETGIYDSEYYIKRALLAADVPGSPGCAIFRTKDIRHNLLLDVPNRVGSDFSMHAIGNDLLIFLLTAQAYPKFAVVNETLAYFRDHPASITTSSPKGKIPLHYDLAKGFFAENHIKNDSLIRLLNVELMLHLFKYRDNSYGLNSLADFYPSGGRAALSYSYLAKRLSSIIIGVCWRGLSKIKSTTGS